MTGYFFVRIKPVDQQITGFLFWTYLALQSLISAFMFANMKALFLINILHILAFS